MVAAGPDCRRRRLFVGWIDVDSEQMKPEQPKRRCRRCEGLLKPDEVGDVCDICLRKPGDEDAENSL